MPRSPSSSSPMSPPAMSRSRPSRTRRAIHIKATGAAMAGRTVTLQAIKKLCVISNFSTTDSVDFVLGSATITLAPAEDGASPTMALVYTDGAADGLFAVSSGIGGGGGGALYDLGFYYSGGPPGASEFMFKWVATRNVELAADLAGSFGDIGANPTEGHPVFASQLKRRLREGARLIVVDPRTIDLVRQPHIQADYHLKLRPGTNVALANALAHVVVTEGLVSEAFVAERCEADSFAMWREFVARPENSPEASAAVSQRRSRSTSRQ